LVEYINNTVYNTVVDTVSNTVLNNQEKEHEKYEEMALKIAKKYNLSAKQYSLLVESLRKYREKIQNKPRIVRSYREFLFCEIDARIGRILDKNSVSGMHRSDYIALARAILKDMCNKIFFSVVDDKEKIMKRIVNYNLRYFSKRVILREDLTRLVINELYGILYEAEKLKWEFIHRAEREGLPFVYIRKQT